MDEGRRGVECDDSDLVVDAAEERIEHGAEPFVLVEVACAGTAGLEADDEREGLAAGVLVKVQGLGDAVVGEDEVVGLEGVDERAGFSFDECRDEDEGGVDGDGVGWIERRGLRGLLGAGGCGEEERDQETIHGVLASLGDRGLGIEDREGKGKDERDVRDV